ncbi:MAG: ABC transporter ATP-binding protein [Halanaerobiales bacterium]|nr:ABC transporter ATP-binding protein [Halanaerobiales bacterium]
MIEVKGVKKDYPLGKTTVQALKGIDLVVETGAFLSIVGPSGSGKTTLLNIIGCIDTPTAGTVKIQDEEITALPEQTITDLRLHKIGFIFQNFNLIPVLNVRENVEFPLLLMKNQPRALIDSRVKELVRGVGLIDQIEQRPAELSGGQRQRVAIARALVTNPEIILADEPTANLDSETSESILQLMRQLNQSEKTTFIFSTHDPEVLKHANSIIQLRDGLLVGAGVV